MTVANIPTRFAIVKRAQKILKEVDAYFEEAADFGLSVADADPTGEMMAVRKGIVAMLARERQLGLVRMENEENSAHE